MRLLFVFALLITTCCCQAQTPVRERHHLVNPSIGYTGFKSHYLDVGVVRNWRNDTTYALVHYELLVGATMDKTTLGTATFKMRTMNPRFHFMDIGVMSRLYTDLSSCNLGLGPEISLGTDHFFRVCYSYQWKVNSFFAPQISPHCFSLYIYFHTPKKR